MSEHMHERLLATIDELVDARAEVGNAWVGREEDVFYEVRARVDDECDADPEFALLLRHYLAQEVYMLRRDRAANTRPQPSPF